MMGNPFKLTQFLYCFYEDYTSHVIIADLYSDDI